MKNTLLILFTSILTLLFISTANAQETALDKHFEANLKLLGVGINYEYPVNNQLTIVGKVEYNMGLFGNSDYVDYIASLSLGVESRYYYNYNKRVRKNKNVKHNAANFFSLGFDYVPNVLTTTSSKYDVEVQKSTHLSPMWNIRRNIAQSNFNYEVGIGLDFYKIHYDDIPTESHTAPALRLSIGYNF